MLCLLGSGTVLRVEEKALQPSFLKSGLGVPFGAKPPLDNLGKT